MDFCSRLVIVIALTAVGADARPAMDAGSVTRALQTNNENGSPDMAVDSDKIIELIVHVLVSDNATAEMKVFQCNTTYTAVEIDKAVQGANKILNLERTIQLVEKMFHRQPSNYSAQVLRRLKRENDNLNNPSQRTTSYASRRVLRNIENKYLGHNTNLSVPGTVYLRRKVARYPWQDNFISNNPVLFLADAVYEYAQQLVNKMAKSTIFKKKSLPASLEELNNLTADQIRALSYQHLSLAERTSILFTSVWEGMQYAIADEQRQARIEGFWTWFRWFYVPDIIINILLSATKNTPYHGIPGFYEAFNTNPGGDLRDTVIALREFFSVTR